MSEKNHEFQKLIDLIEKEKEEDPIKASYLIDKSLKEYVLKEEQEVLNYLREKIIFDIKKNKLLVKTSLPTIDLINFLKSLKMDYLFMVCYNELKNRNDVKNLASEFQYFFNKDGFEYGSFQTLIYELMVEKEIDYEYIIKKEKINPKKFKSLLSNKDIDKIKNEVLTKYEKDIANYKIASQVFAGYLFLYWVDILKNKTKNDYETIVSVTEVLLGNKDKKDLKDKNELELYEIFSN
ncbi:hypothetical protein [Metamycoplasma orale]|uniref:Uncharacterized protein n=1 Tax=Metamycoplasma orale TaxID=2121 RepID=A0A448ZZQ1_METOS|nr:hypothetical protein [Metamycoplasma orale]VEU55587.1 Uncharacterised protein [Metamycoplasma orale]VEU56719.1 Uncharacterised protein [Metamycoplasma orale]